MQASEHAATSRLSTLIAGMVSGLFLVFTSVSFAALVYVSPLDGYLQLAINQLLFGAAAAALIIAFLGGYPGTVSMPQGRIAPLVAAMVAVVVGGAALPERELFATAMITVAVSTVSVGAFLYLLGRLGLGGLVRFIPYPVIGGFIAGTGWLLLLGAVRIMSGVVPTPAHLGALLSARELELWLPGLLFGAALFLAGRYWKSVWTFPVMLGLGAAGFFGVYAASGTGPQALMAAGMTLGPLPKGDAGAEAMIGLLADVEWAAIFASGGTLGTILVVSAVSLLLSCSGLELETRSDLDLDKELRAAGLANMVAGSGGGIVSFHALSLSVVARRMGTDSRWVALIAAGLCLLTLFFGSAVLDYLPRALIGGMLAYLGLDFLHRWIVRGWSELSHSEYAIVLAILVIMVSVDYLTGIAAGLVAAVLLFVFTYSRVSVIKTAVSGAELRSNVERGPAEQAVLLDKGRGLSIYRLHGFLFFGTVASLLERIRMRVENEEQAPVSHVVLDFDQVTGMDSSAQLSFKKLLQRAARSGFHVTLCGFQRGLEPPLATAPGEPLRIVADLDRALELCEIELLGELADSSARGDEAETLLTDLLGDAHVARQIAASARRGELADGDELFAQGDESHSMAFLYQGTLSIVLHLPGRDLRLRAIKPGNFVGEMGIYLGERRSASVVADGTARVLELSDDALAELERERPEIALRLHRAMVQLLSRRLANANKAIERLLE
ncbi:MAG: SulP family inorganic anion transporter [Gammaproteobacteria bacterium]